jgi:hypothetical protein
MFLNKYPGVFSHPQMIEIGKKHKMGKLIEIAQDSFNIKKFNQYKLITENMVKILTRSSMVSVFEKPKFRDFVKGISAYDKEALAAGLKEFLHGNEENGFNIMLDILTMGKLAKWSAITVWGAYYQPDYHVFCKPTTVKNVISNFELENLIYKPRPSYQFYCEYRSIINQMKKKVDPGFSSNNAAFCGFLMMSMEICLSFPEIFC